MTPDTPSLSLGMLRLEFSGGLLFNLAHVDLNPAVAVSGPAFEIDGQVVADFRFLRIASERELPNGGREHTLRYAAVDRPGLELVVLVRSFPHSEILRFKYRLACQQTGSLTKTAGAGDIRYFSLAQPDFAEGVFSAGRLAEYQLSHFDPVAHSYLPYCQERTPDELLPGLRFVGPVALFHSGAQVMLAAYEHGADHPDAFLDFHITEAATGRGVEVRAVKGNYYHGQSADGFESVWFELGLHAGDLDSFLPCYRRFFLEEVCENRESRKPNIYYNTWNYQERQKYFRARPYLESMTAERMLAEIEVAHKLGVDVFVIDTGWYKKTGDWLPNLDRFPAGLQEIRRKLDEYGMKLGLWFNPTVAALTSTVFTEHPAWEMTWQGQPRWRGPVWETEESTAMCLASDYADDYIEVMVRLHQELGVSYFKWDAVQQYGCDSPLHQHGTPANSPEERADCYAYQMGLAMIRIVEEVTRRCPGVIVDFDITEGGRFVGLGFLSAGKYFLVNNGPYFSDFDTPRWVKLEPDTINVFFYPGAARPRICRTGARYDPLIPSILFLTHYLPDPPLLAQRNSLAALVLGGNGWWGDLPALSAADVRYLGDQIALYKRVAADVVRAYPRVSGFAGASPEIHEKVNPESCSGLVAFFTVTPGPITHYTQPLNLDCLGEVVGADAWELATQVSATDGAAHGMDRLKITVSLEKNDARVVYILPKT